MAGSSKADMDRFADGSMHLQVSNVFPDIESDIIRKDLSLTHSAEQTINRILDGTVLSSSTSRLRPRLPKLVTKLGKLHFFWSSAEIITENRLIG